MRTLLFIILLLIQIDSFAQSGNKTDNFNYEVTKVTGDLNKDNLADKVIVSQDTLNDRAPYRLQIFFAQPDGSFTLIVSSIKIIEPQYPDGRNGFRSGNGFSGITIKNGVISINNELLRGHYEHKFRFQNGSFELIGFSEISSDGQGVITTIDFNLLTGIRIEKSERYDMDKILSNRKKKILIRPLPKLQNVKPFETELY